MRFFGVLEFLSNELDDYVAKLSIPTRIIRSPKRIGLIKARLAGARQAKGKILVFLDAHCECTVGNCRRQRFYTFTRFSS